MPPDRRRCERQLLGQRCCGIVASFLGQPRIARDVQEADRRLFLDLLVQAGLGERTWFATARADDYPDHRYGLICFFDTLHDLGDPVAAAEHAAATLAPGGTVLLVEPFAHDRVEDNLSPIGQLYYSGSSLICCAHAISEGGKMVLGAQAGPARLREVFRKAGFSHFRCAAETPFNLIFEARP